MAIQPSIINWLLDSDPSILWQVMRDLLHTPADEVTRQRARIGVEGWGAKLLALQSLDGQWDNTTWMSPGKTSTFDVMWLLSQLGIDPHSQPAQTAVQRVRQHVTWGPGFDHSPFFEGETEACINGRTLTAGAYFGYTSDKMVDRFLAEQLQDGGWNCYAPPSKRSSFHSTICALEGLLAYEQAKGATPAITQARLRGHEYLLERRLLRTASTGNVINLEWTMLSFPTYWHYDILRALDYFRNAGVQPEERMAEAVQRLQAKRTTSGQWLLEHVHPGKVHFDMNEGIGNPSRWITLRALRVLDWYEKSA